MKKFLICIFVIAMTFPVSCTVNSISSAFDNKVFFVPNFYNFKNEVNCLAQNVYFEARDQPTKGQIAVALVTINRAKSRRFPNTICKVIHQASRYSNGKLIKNRCHFSWFCDGLSDKPKDKLAWKISVLIAKAMLKRNDMIEDFLHGSTHYHRKDVNPYWNRKMIRVTTIGDHIFWKDYLND